MEKRSILYNNKKLVYYTSGKGNVVVLIHGFGEDSSVWKNQIDALSGFQLIIPDLPGSGGSDIQEDMSMEGLAVAVQTILTAENVNNCTIIGHSMGGYVTLAFAERFPEQLNGFGLFHSTAYADSEEKMATRKKGIEFISKNGAAAFLKTTTANLFAPVTKEQNPELIEKQINDVSYLSDAALIAYYKSMIKRPDRTNILKQTNLPVLFVLGKYDNAVPLNDGLQQTHMPRLSYIHVLEQSGHMGMMEETEKANIILNQYLTNLQKHHSA